MQTTLPAPLHRGESAAPLPRDLAAATVATPLEAWPQCAVDACAPEGAATLAFGTLDAATPEPR